MTLHELITAVYDQVVRKNKADHKSHPVMHDKGFEEHKTLGLDICDPVMMSKDRTESLIGREGLDIPSCYDDKEVIEHRPQSGSWDIPSCYDDKVDKS